MGYKVNYNEMWELIDIIQSNGGKWGEQLGEVVEKYSALNDPKLFKGAGASSINAYLNDVHGTILSKLFTLIELLLKGSNCYRYGYQDKIDGGDGSKTGIVHTTIVQDEIEDGGEIPRNVQSMIDLNSYIRDEADNIRRSIQDIISLASLAYPDRIEDALYRAKNIAINLNNSVLGYESEEKTKLDSVQDIIEELRNLISGQLGTQRVPVTSYVPGGVRLMCDFDKLDVAEQKVKAEISEMEEYYNESIEHTFNREELLKQEREDQVKWIRWAVTGVCVVATIALTVVTAGAAAPLALGVMGAATGVITAGTNNILDQYVETGFENGIDWSDFGKDVVIGGVTGFVTGYLGGVMSGGSTAGQTFIQKVGQNFVTSVAGEVTEHTISAAWDVTEGIAKGDIKDINGVLNEIESETKTLMGDIVHSGVDAIVDTALGDLFDDANITKDMKDGIGKKIGNAVYTTVTDVTKNVSKDIVLTVTDEAYDAAVDPNRKFDWDNVEKGVEEATSLDSIKDKALSSLDKQSQKAVTDKLVENVKYEDGKFSIDKDENRKFKAKMESKAGADGKVEMVQFENGTVVLKEDYDMAKYNAENYTELDKDVGYKRNRNAKEILGVKTTQGATVIHVDPESISKADYKGKSKVDKYIITPKK